MTALYKEKVFKLKTACKAKDSNMKPKKSKADKHDSNNVVDVNALIADGGLTVSHAAIAARVKGFDLNQTLAYFNTQAINDAIKSVIDSKVNRTTYGNSFVATAAGCLGFLTEENKSIFSGDKGKGSLNNGAHFNYVSKVYGFVFGCVLAKDAKTVTALHKAGYVGVVQGKTCQVLKSKTIL